MKKVILGVALLSQFAYGIEGIPEFTELAKKGNQSLVPLNFFDNSKAEFRKKVEESTQSVASEFRRLNALSELDEDERENQKLLTVINEFEDLNIFCKDEFDKNREKANKAFLHALVNRTKDIMQDEIAQKEVEIIRLQERLDGLLKDAPQTAESLSNFDKIIQIAEENVKTTKKEIENFKVPELIKKKQIDRTFEHFNEKLNEIQNEVQEGKNNLEKTLREVFEKTQKQYEDSTNTLIENLGDRYEDIMANVEERYEDQTKHLAEAYDRQIAIMNDKINEFTALNAQLEKDKELHSLISRVFVINKSLKAEKIMIRSAEINRITDIFEKRAAVQTEYSKFELFSGLLGREDLGVNAKQDDLTKVSEYLNSTKVSQKPSEPIWIKKAFWSLQPFFLFGKLHPVFPDEGFIRSKYRESACEECYDGLFLFRYEMTVNSYNRCKDIENKERKNAYNNAMSKWNAEVARASSISLPSEEFDHLVEQFNVFVNKL